MIKIKININGEEKELNFLNDYLFHRLFSEKGSEKYTIKVVNIITGEKYKSLDFKTTEIYGRHVGNKKSVTDIMALTNDGTLINIEAQIKEQKNFHKRSHYYHSKIFSILLEIGDDYDKLPRIIMINLLDFDLHELDDYHTIFTLCEKNHKYILDDLIETHYIELPKFRKAVEKGKIDLSNPENRLLLILDNQTDEKTFKKVIQMDEFANDLYEKAKIVLQDKASYLQYIREEQAELDRQAHIKFEKEKTAKIERKKGIKEGMEKGIIKGKKEGKKEGEEEKSIEIAIKLKKSNYPLQEIADITGLTKEYIKKL